MLLERLEVEPMPVLLESPMPVELALLEPGLPEDELLSDRMTN